MQYEWMYQPVVGNTGLLYYCAATNVLVQFGTGSGSGGSSYPVLAPGVTTPGVLSPVDYNNFLSKQDPLGFTPENISNKDHANGYPSLDLNGNVPITELGNVGSAGFQPTSAFDTAGAASSAVAAIPLSGPLQTAPALITPADYATFLAKQDALGYTAEDTNNKGLANGYAGLDSTGLVPLAQLPNAIRNLYVNGTQQTAAAGINLIPSGGITISSVYNSATNAIDTTLNVTGGGGTGTAGLTGTSSPSWTPILDGACETQNFTLSGIVANDSILPGWPSTFPLGVTGTMHASATDTVTVQICNLSGVTYTPTGNYTATRVGNTGSGTGTTYTFGQGLTLSGTQVSVNPTGNGTKVVTAGTLSGATAAPVCTDSTGLNITTSNCPSGAGLPDTGNNGIVKRTGLNADAIAVAGTDYYAPGAQIRAADVPNNAANTTGSAAKLSGTGAFTLLGSTGTTVPSPAVGQLGLWFDTTNQTLELIDRNNNTSSMVRILTNGTSTNCNAGDYINGFTSAGVPVCGTPSGSGSGLGTITITSATGGTGASLTALMNPSTTPSGSYTGFGNTTQVQTGNTQDWSGVDLFGSAYNTDYFGTTTLRNAFGHQAKVNNRTTGTITTARAFYAVLQNLGTGSITTGMGLHVLAAANTGGGTIGTFYGVKIDATTAATTNWSLYVTGGNSFFGGPVQAKFIQSGSSTNTDLDGLITMTGGSGTYTFTGTYATAPICVANDTQAASAVQVAATTTTLTLTGVSGHIATYICHGRT